MQLEKKFQENLPGSKMSENVFKMFEYGGVIFFMNWNSKNQWSYRIILENILSYPKIFYQLSFSIPRLNSVLIRAFIIVSSEWWK